MQDWWVIKNIGKQIYEQWLPIDWLDRNRKSISEYEALYIHSIKTSTHLLGKRWKI